MTHTIELSENSIQILDKQELTDRHIMVIKVGVGNMPAHKAMQYMEDIRKAFADKVAPAELVIMPLENIIEVFERGE
jgi:hypothetical protein